LEKNGEKTNPRGGKIRPKGLDSVQKPRKVRGNRVGGRSMNSITPRAGTVRPHSLD